MTHEEQMAYDLGRCEAMLEMIVRIANGNSSYVLDNVVKDMFKQADEPLLPITFGKDEENA